MNGSDFWKAFAVPLGLLILFVIAILGVYGLSRNFVKPPTVDLISGKEIVTDQTEVPVTGVVHNTSKLKINGKEVPVSDDGGFSAVVPVNVGENTITIAAGNNAQAKTDVKVTREEPAKAITATSTTADNLTTSGPVETMMGSFGLAAILMSLMVYRRSVRQKSLQKA